jgi:hypothetical protein
MSARQRETRLVQSALLISNPLANVSWRVTKDLPVEGERTFRGDDPRPVQSNLIGGSEVSINASKASEYSKGFSNHYFDGKAVAYRVWDKLNKRVHSGCKPHHTRESVTTGSLLFLCFKCFMV